MKFASLHPLFIEELRDLYSAENQLLKALPKMAKAATHPDLRAAFEGHLQETQGHVTILEQVFESIGETAKGKFCDGIAGIIAEGKKVMEEDLEPEALDACLIAGGQRAEHYEMAAYGTLVAWAETLGHRQAAKLLNSILDQEKAADKKLSSLAEGGINAEAKTAKEVEKATNGKSRKMAKAS